MLDQHATSSTSRLSKLPEDQLGRLMQAPAFPHVVQLLARGFDTLYKHAPRVSSLFASQQRWLLCHAGLALHFRASLEGTPGLTRRALGLLAVELRLASRNTAYAFFDEALKYGVVRPAMAGGGERTGEVELSPEPVSMLIHWYDLHFKALDLIDGAGRSGRFLAQPERALAVLAPRFAPALLSSTQVRMPGPFYTIFTWADAGGNLMDRLIAGIEDHASPRDGCFPTDVMSISQLAEAFALSRSHTSRKLAAAEALGGIGWSGRRGYSSMWISTDFYREYARAQAQKLFLLDNAFTELSPAPSVAFLPDHSPAPIRQESIGA
ncbi:hypothetical protein MUO32_13990 [Shinella sp. CPCC 101442]|uniref:hypothetical protein n=1 Tax=Shinella sp. CPCC 101442 TaxID=2932265 RepID=UPI0021535C8B|nr:hypothetical protein [Shinella sp. CPCC 101442]MCR6500155.1 hypothetical protein [Shinella sp. CPCC 101442]